jgi:LEA14-like dessication related protein
MKRIVGVLLCCLVLSGCIKLQNPEITYRSTQIKPSSFQDLQTSFQFDINNPNLIPLKGVIDYAIKINNQELLSGTSSEISVDSQKQSSFSVDTSINLPKAYGSLSSLITELGKGEKYLPYAFSGTYRTTIAGIDLKVPLKAEGFIPLPNLPTVKLNSVKMEKFDLRTPTLKISATISNGNSIPINLDSAEYKLQSNSAALAAVSLDKPLNVAPNSSQEVSLTTTVDLSKVDPALVKKILSNSAAFDMQQEIKNIQ